MKLRSGTLFVVGALLVAQLASLLSPFLIQRTYALGKAESLLSKQEPSMAANLTFDSRQQMFSFDNKRSVQAGTMGSAGGGVTATAYADASKGISVSDSTNQIDFKLMPKFRMAAGQKDGNRIVYPLIEHDGWAVYTMTGIGAKEDIILNSSNQKALSFEYEMELGDGLEARIEADGGIGIYGNKLFSGNITTGTEKDAALLQKARQNASKNSLLFTIPAPTIKETDPQTGKVLAAYELNGKSLKVNVRGLDAGHYPLTIDPSIYVVTASQFMYGNNETNINFDVANKLIKKGRTSGARFDSWQSTTNLPTGVFAGGTVASGGYIYQVGGSSVSGGGGGTTISTQGSSNYVVPDGVTSINVKMWGGGGGSGGSSSNRTGGNGGGGGYVSSTLSVTPGETLTVYVGGGGGGGTFCTGFFCGGGQGGGGGGGYSSIYRSSTPLLIAAGGGGGGGARTSATAGGQGGAGGGTSGADGSTVSSAIGGGGGTQSGGGSAGTGGACVGNSGSSLTGAVAKSWAGSCGNSSVGNGGLATGGAGGSAGTDGGGGGGGGSGYFGGGSGALGNANGGSGGGGGSTYATGTNITSSTGSGTTPGNNSDPSRGSAGNGATAPSTGASSAGNSGSNGLVLIGMSSGPAANPSVNWAKFDTGNGTVVNANPGNGTCAGWCSATAYDLPESRANFSLVAYNGYLYAMGGNDESGSNTLDHKYKTIYVAKLGANGEPRLWHPTDSDQANWVYWYHDDTNMTLPSERIQGAAVAYNNKMYFIGGLDNSSATGSANSTVWVANILPNGKLGSWSTSTALTSGGPGATYGATALVYNDNLYLVGGAASPGSTPSSSNVYYIKINADGTLASSWVHTNDFATGRVTGGGTNAVIWGGYMYISGGCSSTSGSNYCTGVLSDTQIASINADGSLGSWTTVSNVTNQTMGISLLAWRDVIYAIGGCTGQDSGSGACNSGASVGITYGLIKQDGEVSTISSSVASGTAPCSGATPTNCNIPSTGSVGNYLNASVVSNGYLYVIGGCTNVGCTTTSGGVAFTQVSSNGDLIRPASCPSESTATNGWCVMNTSISGGIAATAPVIYNDTIYLVGGFSGSALKNTVYRATVTPGTGLLGSWSSDSMTTAGATSVSYAYATARANPTSASTDPGNLYVFGGCTTSGSGPDCSAYTQNVYKCAIATSGAVSGCTTTGQLQIGTPTGASGAGLALMGGTVYGNYIYLIGGSAPGVNELDTVRYAKFDNNNNVVTTFSGWAESPQTLASTVRGGSSFSHNGYLYSVGGYNSASSTVKDTVQYIKINTSDGSLDTGGWKQSVVTITGRWGLTIPVSNSHAYVIGGCTTGAALTSCSAATSTVQRFKIYNNDSGSPNSWTSSANQYSTTRWYAGTAVYNGYIYVAGGCVGVFFNDCGTTTTNVQRAPIDIYGAIGSWTDTTAALPVGLGGIKLLVAGGTLYVIGGITNGYTTIESNVYYGTPTGTGDITSWGTASNGLPQSRALYGATVWNNRMYILGGLSLSCTTVANTCGTVYISPQQNSGGDITSAWSTASNTFNVPRIGAAAVAYANNLYILGGKSGDGSAPYLNDTQYTKIDSSTGNLSTWNYSSSLPAAVWLPDAFVANGYLYALGGYRNGTTCATSTMIAPVSSNTSIASGNNPTGLGTWFESSTTFSGGRYGASAQYSNGKAYLLGGYCPSAGVSPNVQQTALLTQPQVAKYSISFDTDTNVYPNSYLANGTDNSIGAQWQLKYRSMSDPGAVTNLGTGVDCSSSVMSDWGQETTVTPLTLGSLGTYNPLDASGTNMSCGRYYYLNLSIDAQNSFGFPEDVTRGPTITDISLRYTAAPSKRSLHGRTFINGIQTPLDTPKYAN